MFVYKSRFKVEQAWADIQHNCESSALTGLKN